MSNESPGCCWNSSNWASLMSLLSPDKFSTRRTRRRPDRRDSEKSAASGHEEGRFWLSHARSSALVVSDMARTGRGAIVSGTGSAGTGGASEAEVAV